MMMNGGTNWVREVKPFAQFVIVYTLTIYIAANRRWRDIQTAD